MAGLASKLPAQPVPSEWPVDLPLAFSTSSALNLELRERPVDLSVDDHSPKFIETIPERVSPTL